MIQGASRVEKLAHSLHMQEIWQKTGNVYSDMILSNPPSDDICNCAIDEDKNGITDALVSISQYFRHWGKTDGDSERAAGPRRCPNFLCYHFSNDGIVDLSNPV